MCDFSLQAFKSRPAKVADRLITYSFGHGTTGFAENQVYSAGDLRVAVCVLPGTEIAFDAPITAGWVQAMHTFEYRVGIFRQINKDKPQTHHDALEFPDGMTVLLTQLTGGQTATVLQLPAEPKNEAEAQEQKRLEVVA